MSVRKNYPVSAAESSQLRDGRRHQGAFQNGVDFPGRWRIFMCVIGCIPPEKKERAFQDQWIKLVFIGSKLERPREQSCGRFTLFREEGAHWLEEGSGRKKETKFFPCLLWALPRADESVCSPCRSGSGGRCSGLRTGVEESPDITRQRVP